MSGGAARAVVVLARGEGVQAARRALLRGRRDAEPALIRHQRADARFWAAAPRLIGDWPAHWRRGTVYDLETLRAVVRPPRGVFRRSWDGMQLQAPRLVLAEAALDSLALGHADPQLATRVLLSAFADAPAPNVPCIREDGSPNMVAADGSECGTAPEWCFPFYCAELLFRLSGDRSWLADLYPPAAHYLTWWLHHRTDRDGWLHYACSWESGQDDSPRFGPDVVGPEDIRHVRPVDLQAAVAQAATLLATWAERLDRPDDAGEWRVVAERYRARTQMLWRDGWFRDFDASTGAWSTFRDVMHLAPLLCRMATAEQLAALEPALADLPPHGRWGSLQWPPVVFTAVEAALAAGRNDLASHHTTAVIDRVYRAMDAAVQRPDGPLPGVAVEHWPADGTGGAEAYGWGALGTLLLLRGIVGFRPDANGDLILAPALPPSLMVSGRSYRVGPLPFFGRRIQVTYATEPDASSGRLDVLIAGLWAERVTARSGAVIPHVHCGGIRFAASNLEEYRIRVAGA